MRKRGERKRDKHTPESSEEGEPEVVDAEDGGEVHSESVKAAADEVDPGAAAPAVVGSDAVSSDASVPGAVTRDMPEPETVDVPRVPEPAEMRPIGGADRSAQSPEPDAAKPAAEPAGVVSGAEPVAGAAQSASPAMAVGVADSEHAADLDALGKILEQSLTGGSSEGPLPTVSSPGQATNLELALPPQISATPEDILGVPTHHTAMQELQQQAVEDEADSATKEAATLPGAGSGPPPMEAFEERAQMAKEVLRATSSQPSHSSVPVSGSTTESESDQTERTDESEEDVRFSEDLTISVKRRRKLFGR